MNWKWARRRQRNNFWYTNIGKLSSFFRILSLESGHGSAIMILSWNGNPQNTSPIIAKPQKIRTKKSDLKSDAHSLLGLGRCASWISPQRLHDKLGVLYLDIEDSTIMIKTCSISSPHFSLQQMAIEQLGFHVILHTSYSPDLAPSDYYRFRHLEKHLKGQGYFWDDDLKTAMSQFFFYSCQNFNRNRELIYHVGFVILNQMATTLN